MTIYDDLQEVLNHHQVSLSQVLLHLLDHNKPEVSSASLLRADLITQSDAILEGFHRYSKVQAWISQKKYATYKEELLQLASVDAGWHFSAATATVEQIEGFELGEMHSRMAELAPQLVGLLETLVRAKDSPNKRRRGAPEVESVPLASDLDGLVYEDLVPRALGTEVDKRVAPSVIERRRQAIQKIVSVDSRNKGAGYSQA